MYFVKEMPKEERPRERLIECGPEALSNEELLAILLRTGDREISVMDLSKKVLYHLNSLEDLKRMTVFELMTIRGIKEAKACALIAAIELGKRLSLVKREGKVVIRSSYDVYHHIHQKISHLMQEHFMCLYLTTKSELITEETIFIGTINQTLIHPREIFKTAVKLSVAAVIFVHNHPTGDSRPSKADLIATETLMQAAELMGIDLIDHIIIGKDEFYSIKDNKQIKL